MDARIGGPSLVIERSCARRVEIRVDPDLHDQVALHATADRQEELDRVRAGTGAIARLHAVEAGCWRPEPRRAFMPTVDLVLRVPPTFALSIADEGGPN